MINHTSLLFSSGRIRRLHTAAADHTDDAPTLSNDQVVLKVLTQADADPFFRLYRSCESHDHGSQYPVLPEDTAESFALRIVAACELIWTIRLVRYPTVIIGDCALHHWVKEHGVIEFGGTLLPACWGQGIMQAALQLVVQHSIEHYETRSLACTTTTQNNRANRFAEKMGFSRINIQNDTIRWEKSIC